MAGFLGRLGKRDGTIRDGFWRRPADFSGRTRFAADEDVPDLDACLLPDRLAWHLYTPLLISQLQAMKVADTIKSAKECIERQNEEAHTALKAVCSSVLLLAAPVSGPWPMFALRPRLTSELALKVHPALLDQIGWENLGQRVRLFAVLSVEATDQARERLLPSVLSSRTMADTFKEGPSPFDLEEATLIDDLTLWAAERRSFPLGAADHFLLGTGEAFDA